MKKTQITLFSHVVDDFSYNYKLDVLTKFNLENTLVIPSIKKISLNFGFKDITFNKKKMIPFLIFLELISNQKIALTKSRKTLMHLKIKKGDIAGCKVTLRNKNIHYFLETLMLILPRFEDFKGFRFIKENKKLNSFSTTLSDLSLFYGLEFAKRDYLRNLNLVFITNTISKHERIFLLTYNKIPII